MIEIGRKIKEIAKRENRKLDDIAKYVGYSSAGFSRILQSGDFKISILVKISEFLEINITDLIGDSQKSDVFKDELKLFVFNLGNFRTKTQIENILQDETRFNEYNMNEFVQIIGTETIINYIENSYRRIVFGNLFDSLFVNSEWSFFNWDLTRVRELIFTKNKTEKEIEINYPYNIEDILSKVFNISDKNIALNYLKEIRNRETYFEQFIKNDSVILKWAIKENIISKKLLDQYFMITIREFSPRNIR